MVPCRRSLTCWVSLVLVVVCSLRDLLEGLSWSERALYFCQPHVPSVVERVQRLVSSTPAPPLDTAIYIHVGYSYSLAVTCVVCWGHVGILIHSSDALRLRPQKRDRVASRREGVSPSANLRKAARSSDLVCPVRTKTLAHPICPIYSCIYSTCGHVLSGG